MRELLDPGRPFDFYELECRLIWKYTDILCVGSTVFYRIPGTFYFKWVITPCILPFLLIDCELHNDLN